MSFFKFSSEDIINTEIVAYPSYYVDRKVYTNITGTLTTGSIFLEKKYLNTSLLNRRYQGYSERLGGFTERDGPFSASVEMITAFSGGSNKELFQSILNLYSYYSTINMDYTASFGSPEQSPNRFKIITIPEIYYDREIKSGSFSASDPTNGFYLYDNGRGVIVNELGETKGNIFYSEGLVVLKDDEMVDIFGLTLDIAPEPETWIRTWFKGTHKIPVKIIRCRAPAGTLNCSTNTTFFTNTNSLSASNRNENTVIMQNNTTYITKVGLYNDDYELVAVASLAHPIKKEESQDLQIRLRWDF
jgi:hypothetical protein